TAANYQCMFSDVRVRIDKPVMDLRKIFAANVQTTWVLHRSNRKQHPGGPVLVAVCLDRKATVYVAGDVEDGLSCIDAQVMVENEMNVVREQFFASWLFSQWFQRSLVHLHFIRSREHGPTDRVLANRVGDGTLLDYEVVQALACGSFRSGESRWSCPYNQKVK